MNSETCCSEKCSRAAAYMVAILGTFLIVAGLVALMKHYTAPAPTHSAERGAERAKANAELRAAASEAQKSYGWENQQRGVVHLPVERAKELTRKAYEKPATVRTNWAARAEKANPTPVKPPEVKSAFE